MSEEARKPPVFSCGYSEQNPVYCQQCGGHEHLCRKPPLNAAGQMSAAERDRLREWQAKVIEIWNEYEERQNQKDDLGKSIVRNLTAYLKGKGVGDKGE